MHGPRRHRGFALLTVLWTMAVLALIATRIAASARTESRIARNLLRGAELQAAADGAVHAAAFRLLDHSESGWDAHRAGQPYRLTIDGAAVEVWMVDQSDLISLNAASPELLAAAFAVAGLDASRAAALADAVAAWRDTAPSGAAKAARDAAYRAAGGSYLPPSAAFRSADELRLVLGMPGDLVGRLLPHVSVYGRDGPTEHTADGLAAGALAKLHAVTGYLPPPRVAGLPFAVRITAIARGADGASFTRRGVVRLDPQSSDDPMTILEWH